MKENRGEIGDGKYALEVGCQKYPREQWEVPKDWENRLL